jgi:hypothetical protein
MERGCFCHPSNAYQLQYRRVSLDTAIAVWALSGRSPYDPGCAKLVKLQSEENALANKSMSLRLSGLLAFTLLPANPMTTLKTARIRSSMLGSC